jgi:hypothetical protein
MGKNMIRDPGSSKNILDHIWSSVAFFWGSKYEIICCGPVSGIRCLFDPGSGVETVGSGINILGPPTLSVMHDTVNGIEPDTLTAVLLFFQEAS